MKRVLINSNTFKVLKKTVPQGVDVTNAGADNLAFDVSGNSYAGILFSGVEDSTDGTWSTSSVSGWGLTANGFSTNFQGSSRRFKQIFFSSKGVTQTLSTPPDVVIMLQRSGSTGTGATPSYSYVQKGGTADTDWAGGAVWAATTTSHLLLRIDKCTDLANDMPLDWRISYIVFQTFVGLPELYTA
jgi:hypothetical protein